MTKLLKIFVLVFMALGFVACDEVSEVVDSASKAVDTATKEGKKFAQALSIEQPLLRTEFNDKGDDIIFYIQSQDNNTIIEDIIINRGNCSVIKYVADRDMIRAYRELNGNMLKTTSGKSVEITEFISPYIYNLLDADSKSVYKSIFPIKLTYGKKFELLPYQSIDRSIDFWGFKRRDCKTDDIIEVEVVVNGGGSIVYKPKELMLF